MQPNRVVNQRNLDAFSRKLIRTSTTETFSTKETIKHVFILQLYLFLYTATVKLDRISTFCRFSRCNFLSIRICTPTKKLPPLTLRKGHAITEIMIISDILNITCIVMHNPLFSGNACTHYFPLYLRIFTTSNPAPTINKNTIVKNPVELAIFILVTTFFNEYFFLAENFFYPLIFLRR